MPSIVVDTGPLVALFDKDDRYHGAAKQFVENTTARLITNFPVITEVLFLLSFSVQAQTDLLAWTAASLDIDQETAADLPRIVDIITKYADLPADFADASLVALCERRHVASVATLDSHFNVYRTAERKRLQNAFPEV